MKVIYSGVKNDYLNPKRGLSFEHNNFYGTFIKMKEVDLIYFPYDRILEIGKERFNKELLDLVIREKPDFFLAMMFTDELKFDTLKEIKKHTKSIAWMADDHWRFSNYSKYYAPFFSLVVTTYSRALEWYKKDGFNNVIRSEWASNPNYWFCKRKRQHLLFNPN